MKNYKYLFIIVASIILFASCSGDDDGGETDLVGTWVEMDTHTSVITITFNAYYTGKEITVDEDDISTKEFTWNVHSNDWLYVNYKDGSYFDGWYTIKDNKLTIGYENDDDPFKEFMRK